MIAAAPMASAPVEACPESSDGTTTRPTTSPTTNALPTVSRPNAVLPAKATAKIFGCSRMARPISPNPRTNTLRSVAATPLPPAMSRRRDRAHTKVTARSDDAPYTLMPALLLGRRVAAGPLR